MRHSGTVSDRTVRLEEGATVKLDPNASVRVVGDIKVPQPSKEQLQVNATNESDELPFTSYTIFKVVRYGSGWVDTGWSFDLSDTTRPKYQHCSYKQMVDEGLAGRMTIAITATPRRLPKQVQP